MSTIHTGSSVKKISTKHCPVYTDVCLVRLTDGAVVLGTGPVYVLESKNYDMYFFGKYKGSFGFVPTLPKKAKFIFEDEDTAKYELFDYAISKGYEVVVKANHELVSSYDLLEERKDLLTKAAMDEVLSRG